MSEYQYYEFRAIDRPLDEADRGVLRRISSRAEITPSRFTNVYNWGDFKGDPRKLMERWFDLHLYVANWGTRRMMLRIPKRCIEISRLDDFVREVDEVKLIESGENLIVDVGFDSDESEIDYPDSEGDGWLDSLAPLRSALISGDLRLFYILWLTAVQRGYVLGDEKEPLGGIGPLNAPLEALAEFFQVDRDLVRAAADRPTSSESERSFAEVTRRAIASMPEDEKTALLLRLVDGDLHVAGEIRNKIRGAWDAAERISGGRRRTVAELCDRGRAVRAERRAEQVRRREAERLRRAQEAERAQRARVDSIRLRGVERVWEEVERDIGYTHASSYDRAVGTLVDLRALAEQTGTSDDFEQRIRSMRQRHWRKRRFIDRLNDHRIGGS